MDENVCTLPKEPEGVKYCIGFSVPNLKTNLPINKTVVFVDDHLPCDDMLIDEEGIIHI